MATFPQWVDQPEIITADIGTIMEVLRYKLEYFTEYEAKIVIEEGDCGPVLKITISGTGAYSCDQITHTIRLAGGATRGAAVLAHESVLSLVRQ